MQRSKCLTNALRAHVGTLLGTETAGAASQINAAARLFSSAATTSRLAPIAQFGKQDERFQHSQFVFPQQQLTSLLSFPHARAFSTSDSDELPSHEDTASSLSSFDPSMVLDAVTNSEEGSWLAAREDCWFFNRYMQSVLRFAQETTGLPW